MRLIDADKIIFDYSGLAHIAPNDFMGIAKYFSDQINAIPPIVTPPDVPLTLEQLREMDGEPVWVETADIKKANRWAFVDVGCEFVRFFDTRCGVKCQVMGNHFRTYGKTWLAYRRRPEKETT